MPRERRVDYKSSTGRKRKGYNDVDDDSDEDYVAEEEESSYEFDASEDECFVVSEACSKAGSSEDAEETSSSEIVSRRCQRRRTQVGKKAISGNQKKKRWTVDSGTSDPDFVISEEEFLVGDRVMVPRRRKKSVTSRNGLPSESKTRDYDDDFYDAFDRDLNVERVMNERKPGRVYIEKEVKVKGKEKDDDDLAKKVCGICLSDRQKGTIRGILNCCSHFFCLACIVEWSKVESRCPICKRRFLTITKSSKCDLVRPMSTTVIRVKKRNQVYQPTEEELRVLLNPYENIVCMECHLGGDDSLMLLCDICDSSAHTYCVGLGRVVPEGNWYCDCCRFSGEGSLQPQVHEALTAASNNVSNASAEDTDSKNLQTSSIFQRSESSHGNAEDTALGNLLRNTNFSLLESLHGQSSSQGLGLNLSPINLMSEDNGVASTPLPGGTSTLLGWHDVRQGIHIVLSNRISRQENSESSVPESNLHNQPFASVKVPNSNASHSSKVTNHMYQFPDLPKNRNVPRSSSNLAPCIFNQASKFQHVEGAKSQVQSMVKYFLRKLSQQKPLDRSAFKKVARNATHTVLAECGIEHRRSMVSSLPFQPPNNCIHDLDGGPINLVRGCCSSCLFWYVKNVVKMLA